MGALASPPEAINPRGFVYSTNSRAWRCYGLYSTDHSLLASVGGAAELSYTLSSDTDAGHGVAYPDTQVTEDPLCTPSKSILEIPPTGDAAQDTVERPVQAAAWEIPTRPDVTPCVGVYEKQTAVAGNRPEEDVSTFHSDSTHWEDDLQDPSAVVDSTHPESLGCDDAVVGEAALRGQTPEILRDRDDQTVSDSCDPLDTCLRPQKMTPTAPTPTVSQTIDTILKPPRDWDGGMITGAAASVRHAETKEFGTSFNPREDEGEKKITLASLQILSVEDVQRLDNATASVIIKGFVKDGRFEKLIEEHGFQKIKEFKESARHICQQCRKSFSRQCELRFV